MRRLLPAALCAATAIVLPACDQAPEGPTNEEEQALYNFRNAPVEPVADGYAGNGDVEVRRGDDDDDDDIILVDIIGPSARSADGTVIQNFVGETITDPAGATLCTTTVSDDGLFLQLRDTDDTVLMSTLGKWVFDGAPQLAGKSPWQQFTELQSTLRYTFQGDSIVEGHAYFGEEMAEVSEHIQYANDFRKLVLASELEGYCGGVGL